MCDDKKQDVVASLAFVCPYLQLHINKVILKKERALPSLTIAQYPPVVD
jgi:hypothetical protein